MKPKVIVLDDDVEILKLVEKVLIQEDYEVSTYESPEFLLRDLEKDSESVLNNVHLFISDFMLPNVNGLEFIRENKKYFSEIPTILITAHATLESAVEAMREGVFDYLVKPVRVNELRLAVDKAVKFFRVANENKVLKSEVRKSWKYGDIIGKSAGIKKVFDLVSRVSATDATVLITGESGTGKELIARSIHESGHRAQQPFVAINCSAIPEGLLESELFGHGKGSFTGASFKRKGLFEEANNGTIFLDEIGDMPAHLQSKLLRVLQEKEIKPVGESKPIDINVRVIAATHRNLGQLIKDGDFREDLYFRLSVLPIHIPPLRDRKEDIPLLAEYFLKMFSAAHGKSIQSYSKEAMLKFLGHTWQGNIRELRNTIERAIVLTDGTEILPDAVMFDDISQVEESSAVQFDFPDDKPLKEIERQYIQHILSKSDGVKDQAARILGIDRKTLYRKEKAYGLSESRVQ